MDTTLEGVGFVVRSDSMGLAQVLAGQRAIVDQAVGLGVFVGGCVVWRFCPLREPEPFVGVLLVVGAIAVVIELALVWAKHEEAIVCADELILAGFFGDGRRTRVERAVSRRLCSIETPRARGRLAEALRWRLRLAEGTARPSPGYVRAGAFPPLGRSQRRVLLDERVVVSMMANRLEHAPVDPRALVILWGMVTGPPPLEGVDEGRTSEEVRSRIHAAWALIKDDWVEAASPPRTGHRRLHPGRRA